MIALFAAVFVGTLILCSLVLGVGSLVGAYARWVPRK